MISWLEIKIIIPEARVSVLEEFFNAKGALAITVQDAKDEPIYEPELNTTPLWQHNQVTALFEAEVDSTVIKDELNNLLTDEELKHLSIETLAEQDWVRMGQRNFSALDFGHGLWICPSWETSQLPDTASTVIELDPGLAFGTGTHATTAMCLRWLAAHPPTGTVLDFGCGSGILAIAASKLGATKVYALDNDPQAMLSTQQNAASNGTAVHLLEVDEAPAQPVDLLIANILAQPLCDLAAHLKTLVKPAGQILLSGILTTQAEQVINTYLPDFKVKILEREDDWLLLGN